VARREAPRPEIVQGHIGPSGHRSGQVPIGSMPRRDGGANRAECPSFHVARLDRDGQLFRFDSSRYLRLSRRSYPGIARVDRRLERSTTPWFRRQLDMARTVSTEPIRPRVAISGLCQNGTKTIGERVPLLCQSVLLFYDNMFSE
jgi:hypothetical protein